MTEIEIGRGKRGRRAYSFDDIAVVPSRRTRDPEEVSVSWQIDAYHFDTPVMAAPMDSVVSPESAIALGKLGALPVLDLEGLWTRYEDPTAQLAEIAGLDPVRATPRMQEIYAEPIKPELIAERPAPAARGGRHGGRSPCRRSAPSSTGRPLSTRGSTSSSSAVRRCPPSTSPVGRSRSTSSGSSTSSTCPSSWAAPPPTRRPCT